MQIELDITPDMSFAGDNVEVPEGYHLTASMGSNSKPTHESGELPFIYPAGIGQAIMNGCYGTGYELNDPCYQSRTDAGICNVNII